LLRPQQSWGASIFAPTKTVAADPVLLGKYFLDPGDKYRIQMATIDCDAWAEENLFKHGVLRPWITAVDGITEISKPPYEPYSCLGVG
jgi:hypothetical protein